MISRLSGSSSALWFLWLLLVYASKFSGGSVDEPGRPAAGCPPLQSAMEDPVQGHERRTEGSSTLVL
jgi:hypothetical protein